jgi:hypothetical protein
MAPEPSGPFTANGRRQHEVIEEIAQSLGFDVEADVVFGALTENLFVDAGLIAAVVEVVADRWTAPPNVERKLDATACLPGGRIVQIFGESDRPGRRA